MHSLNITIGDFWTAKGLDPFRAIEPYRPALATSYIIGKIIYQLIQQKNLEKEIKFSGNHIRMLKSIQQSNPKQLKTIATQIKHLEDKKKKKSLQLRVHQLSLLQVPALTSLHPDKSPWISLSAFSQRTATISSQNILNNLDRHTLVFHAISLAGICIAFCKQTGFIEEENSVAQGLLVFSFCANLLEEAHSIQKRVRNLMRSPNTV